MSATAPARPSENEYAAYYGKYIALVEGGDIVETLERQSVDTLALLRGIKEERESFRYEPGKWSIKEVAGHLIDAERIFAYRALAIARGEQKPLPGMEQDEYMAHADFDSRTLADLAEEFEHVRRSNVLMFRNLDAEAWSRRGTASDNEVSVRALAYIIAGHEAHHIRILRERYL
ncbi:MAG TPA: DinB family protein [Pyrinomonadaceae bacterium]|nr:DinB family protein [Pyrinomonadaceae bacterium]